jgi:threonine dehydrogenase-like Zn-dependent dehydrogenase
VGGHDDELGAPLRRPQGGVGDDRDPTEIFEVTEEIAQHQELFARLISHRVPFSDVERGFELTLTPGAAEKVVVTFDEQP